MPSLTEKARLGRTFALADLARSLVRTSRDHHSRATGAALFVSSRAKAGRSPEAAWMAPPPKTGRKRWSAADLLSPLWASYGARVH